MGKGAKKKKSAGQVKQTIESLFKPTSTSSPHQHKKNYAEKKDASFFKAELKQCAASNEQRFKELFCLCQICHSDEVENGLGGSWGSRKVFQNWQSNVSNHTPPMIWAILAAARRMRGKTSADSAIAYLRKNKFLRSFEEEAGTSYDCLNFNAQGDEFCTQKGKGHAKPNTDTHRCIGCGHDHPLLATSLSDKMALHPTVKCKFWRNVANQLRDFSQHLEAVRKMQVPVLQDLEEALLSKNPSSVEFFKINSSQASDKTSSTPQKAPPSSSTTSGGVIQGSLPCHSLGSNATSNAASRWTATAPPMSVFIDKEDENSENDDSDEEGSFNDQGLNTHNSRTDDEREEDSVPSSDIIRILSTLKSDNSSKTKELQFKDSELRDSYRELAALQKTIQAVTKKNEILQAELQSSTRYCDSKLAALKQAVQDREQMEQQRDLAIEEKVKVSSELLRTQGQLEESRQTLLQITALADRSDDVAASSTTSGGAPAADTPQPISPEIIFLLGLAYKRFGITSSSRPSTRELFGAPRDHHVVLNPSALMEEGRCRQMFEAGLKQCGYSGGLRQLLFASDSSHWEIGLHGTLSDRVASILLGGFDPAQRGDNGQVHGEGEYFDLSPFGIVSLHYTKGHQCPLAVLLLRRDAGGMPLQQFNEAMHNGEHRVGVVKNRTDTAFVLPFACLTVSSTVAGKSLDQTLRDLFKDGLKECGLASLTTRNEDEATTSTQTNQPTQQLFFKDDAGSWQPFSPQDLLLLETAIRGKTRSFTTALTTNKRFEYRFDFEAMTQTNLNTGKQRALKVE